MSDDLERALASRRIEPGLVNGLAKELRCLAGDLEAGRLPPQFPERDFGAGEMNVSADEEEKASGEDEIPF